MAKRKKEIGDTILKEAGERLKKAVEEKDFLKIGLAQRTNDAESVEVFVLKKKSKLIDCLSKKPKK